MISIQYQENVNIKPFWILVLFKQNFFWYNLISEIFHIKLKWNLYNINILYFKEVLNNNKIVFFQNKLLETT